jgi:hypothetical protein
MKLVRSVNELVGTVMGIAVTATVTISESTVAIDARYDKPFIVPQWLIENRVNAALVKALG